MTTGGAPKHRNDGAGCGSDQLVSELECDITLRALGIGDGERCGDGVNWIAHFGPAF